MHRLQSKNLDLSCAVSGIWSQQTFLSCELYFCDPTLLKTEFYIEPCRREENREINYFIGIEVIAEICWKFVSF